MNNNDNEQLLYRYALSHSYSENILSDIVWCYCQDDDKIRDLFFNFMFPHAKDVVVNCVYREFIFNDVRHDFLFMTSNGLYGVESKIGDNNYDSALQYLNNVGSHEKLAYILKNNQSGDGYLSKIGVSFKLWEEFANKIEDQKIKNIIFIMLRKYDAFSTDNKLEKFKKNEYFEQVKHILGVNWIENNDWHSLRTFGYYLNTEQTLWFGFRFCFVADDNVQYCFGVRKDMFLNKINGQFKKLEPIGYFDEYGFTYFTFKCSIKEAAEEFKRIYV